MHSGKPQANEPEAKNPEEATVVWSSENYICNHGIFPLSSGHLLIELYNGQFVAERRAANPLTGRTEFDVVVVGNQDKFRFRKLETSFYPHDTPTWLATAPHHLPACLAKASTDRDAFIKKLKSNYKFSNVKVVFVFAEHPKTSTEAPSLPASPTALCEGDNNLFLYDFSDDELYKLTGPITFKYDSQNSFLHVEQENGYLLRVIPELKKFENEIFNTHQFLRFPHVTTVDGQGKFGRYFETLTQGLPRDVAKLTEGYAGTWLSWFYGEPVKKVGNQPEPTQAPAKLAI